MKEPKFVLVPPRCTTEEILSHWRDFWVMVAICVICPFVVPNPAFVWFSGAVAVYCVAATTVATAWVTVVSWRSRSNPPVGPKPPTWLQFAARWLTHMAKRVHVVRESFKRRGASETGNSV
jgi:hypothetical protein